MLRVFLPSAWLTPQELLCTRPWRAATFRSGRGSFLVSPRNCLPEPGNYASRLWLAVPRPGPPGSSEQAAAPVRDLQAPRAHQPLPAAGAHFFWPPGSARKVSARTGAIYCLGLGTTPSLGRYKALLVKRSEPYCHYRAYLGPGLRLVGPCGPAIQPAGRWLWRRGRISNDAALVISCIWPHTLLIWSLPWPATGNCSGLILGYRGPRWCWIADIVRRFYLRGPLLYYAFQHFYRDSAARGPPLCLGRPDHLASAGFDAAAIGLLRGGLQSTLIWHLRRERANPDIGVATPVLHYTLGIGLFFSWGWPPSRYRYSWSRPSHGCNTSLSCVGLEWGVLKSFGGTVEVDVWLDLAISVLACWSRCWRPRS